MSTLMLQIRPFVKIAAWISVLALAVLSLLPGDDMVRTAAGGHVEHVIAYAGTAMLLGLGFPRVPALQVGAALTLYAALLEVLQRFAPGRGSHVEDWLFSVTGVVIGLALASLAARWMRAGA